MRYTTMLTDRRLAGHILSFVLAFLASKTHGATEVKILLPIVTKYQLNFRVLHDLFVIAANHLNKGSWLSIWEPDTGYSSVNVHFAELKRRGGFREWEGGQAQGNCSYFFPSSRNADEVREGLCSRALMADTKLVEKLSAYLAAGKERRTDMVRLARREAVQNCRADTRAIS